MQALQGTLDELRALLDVDGGGLELDGVDEAARTVRLRLVVETAECPECVMPADILEDIALAQFQRAGAGVDRVVIDDPREGADGG
jgi:hypothetical protein